MERRQGRPATVNRIGLIGCIAPLAAGRWNHWRRQGLTHQQMNERVQVMGKTILIVEDEFLVALNLSHILSAIGFETVGIAPDAQTALRLADAKPDFALVDVNLRDGETGPDIGRMLAKEFGATVLFLTANPASLGDGIDGTVGCMSKPVDEVEVETALHFLTEYQIGKMVTPPPALRVFRNDNDASVSGSAHSQQA
jgi:two-component system, response regulator PdtaR